MGWLFSEAWPTASSMRDHLRDELKKSGNVILDDALTNYGRHYFALVKKGDAPAVIFVALLDKRASNGWTGWGYKDMDEGMHPYTYDCPLRIVDRADADGPADNEDGKNWRSMVRAYHAKRRASALWVKSAKRGDKVWANGREEPYTVAYKVKNTLIGYRHDGSGPYRIPTTRITAFEPAVA